MSLRLDVLETGCPGSWVLGPGSCGCGLWQVEAEVRGGSGSREGALEAALGDRTQALELANVQLRALTQEHEVLLAQLKHAADHTTLLTSASMCPSLCASLCASMCPSLLSVHVCVPVVCPCVRPCCPSMCTSMCTSLFSVHVCVHVYDHVCVHVYDHVYVPVCASMCASMCVSMCASMCVAPVVHPAGVMPTRLITAKTTCTHDLFALPVLSVTHGR
jgi:hypothetical protein